MAKTILKKKNSVWGFILPNFNTYYEATVIKDFIHIMGDTYNSGKNREAEMNPPKSSDSSQSSKDNAMKNVFNR